VFPPTRRTSPVSRIAVIETKVAHGLGFSGAFSHTSGADTGLDDAMNVK
jgi:hypothetical protein